MYRILLLIAILSCGDARRRHDHKSHHHEHCDYQNEKQFYQISNNDFHNSRRAQLICVEQKNDITINYGTDKFILEIGAKNFTENDVNVKIKRKVVYVKAKKDDNRLEAIRILPDIVDTEQAKWEFKDEEVVITIPYKIEFGKDMKVNCENLDPEHNDDDDDVIDVQRLVDTEKEDKAPTESVKEIETAKVE